MAKKGSQWYPHFLKTCQLNSQILNEDPAIRSGYKPKTFVFLSETVEDWKEKYFSADATAEALKAELKLKQSNLDQMKQNNQQLTRECNEKLAQIETLQNSSNQSLSDEQGKVRDMQVSVLFYLQS